MLYYLSDLDYLFGPLRLFKYITVRAFLAGLFALWVGWIFAPRVIAWLTELKLSQSLRTAEQVGKLADLHAAKKSTPTMGGILIFGLVTLATLLFAHWNIYVGAALWVYAGLTALGFADDYLKISKKNSKGVSGKLKLLVQAGITVSALWMLTENETSAPLMLQLWAPFMKTPLIAHMPWAAMALFLFFVIAGSSNAINLTDGIDGLAIGCTVSVALAYAAMAYISGNKFLADYLFASYIPGAGELAVICVALVGASLVFLWYNAYPAEVFMGDTGSLGLGGLIGAIAFMVHQPFTLIIVGGIFVMEAVSVMLQVGSFKLRGKRIFRMAPIHHHFELKGWAEPKVVIRFWILSLIFALVGLSTLKLR